MRKLIDAFMKPQTLPYDFEEWKSLPFAERSKKVCQAWALQGFGAPPFALVFYILKLALYVWIWFYFCSCSQNLGTFSEIGSWWFKLEALGKALFWTCLLEVIGLAGASGPLTARYMPPMGGLLYFLRPKTIKLPLFPNAKIIGGDSRSLVDVVLYAGLLISLFRVCVAHAITPDLVWSIVILLPILGILDRNIFLAARADYYFPIIVCFLFPMETGGALKILYLGIWFWAAFSKLTPSFSSVVSVMICNSPVLKIDFIKKMLFKNYPNDLRTSTFAEYMSHFGTLVEFTLPIWLISTNNSETALLVMLAIACFHTFIFINMPMGVPLEWNVMMVYGGFVLFVLNPQFSILQISNPLIIGVFIICLLVLPILGHLFPKYISFLLSMRYYAGTWAYNVWLFKGDSIQKIDENIVKTSKNLNKQLAMFYDNDTSQGILSRVIAWRLMHIPGRVLQKLMPKAIDNFDNFNDYVWRDGEFMAGEVAGWNFGEGHLSSECLLNAVQKRCNFKSGELRVIMVESPQFHNQNLAWRIIDAKDGLIEEGIDNIRELKKIMAWNDSAIKK